VLDPERVAGVLEAVGGAAAAAVGQEMGDVERKGHERLLEGRHRAGLGLVVLDRQVHPARAAIDGVPVHGFETPRFAYAAMSIGSV
jgi:hypothetical protein